MMDQHSEKRANGDLRVQISKRAVSLAFFDVTADEFIDAGDELVKKPLGERVLLKGRVKQKPHKAFVRLVFIHRVQSNVVEYGEIVLLFYGSLKRFIRFPWKTANTVLAAFVI